MHPDIVNLCVRTDLGLAPHYATIWSMVRGLEARRTFEFGAGGSTAVILDALGPDGLHSSLSTDSKKYTADRFGLDVAAENWVHTAVRSQTVWGGEAMKGTWDFVLHDGAHTREVVTGDLLGILPHVRTFGLVVVHDSQYAKCGAGVRAAIRDALRKLPAMRFSHTTLPYGAGLTIIRVEAGGAGEPICPTHHKDGDPDGLTIPMSI